MSRAGAAAGGVARRPAPSRSDLEAARAAGVPWKLLVDAYGLSRTRLWEILTGHGSRRGEGRKMLTSTSGGLPADPAPVIAMAAVRD
jgi:hypothetical protein